MFNSKKYLNNYSDLTKNGITIKNARSHFFMHGLSENRTDNDICFHTFTPKQKKIVLFTNARDESNLKEWCVHHLLLGFDCIYIFDHLSEKPIIQELYNFDPRICVFRINITSKVKDICINNAINIARSIHSEWMLYLDADEFLVLNNHSNVKDFLSEFNCDLISINWLMFGTNSFIKQPPGLLMSNFIKSDLKLNFHVKTFVKPRCIIKPIVQHTYEIRGIGKNVNKEIIKPNPFIQNNIEYNLTPAYIAHYLYQSEEVYMFRKVNRNTDTGGKRSFDKNLHTYHNEIENTSVKEKYSERIENYLKEREL